MALQVLLGQVHPHWFAGDAPDALDPHLAAHVQRSHLGRRLLLRLLPAETMDGLFAPAPRAAAGASGEVAAGLSESGNGCSIRR